MNQIYFEAKGEALLERIGMTKAEFARRMGIRKQNVKALFKSKNLETIYKAAGVMDVPFEMLIGYIEEPDLTEIPLVPFEEEEGMFTEDDIPIGDSTEERRCRQIRKRKTRKDLRVCYECHTIARELVWSK